MLTRVVAARCRMMGAFDDDFLEEFMWIFWSSTTYSVILIYSAQEIFTCTEEGDIDIDQVWKGISHIHSVKKKHP